MFLALSILCFVYAGIRFIFWIVSIVQHNPSTYLELYISYIISGIIFLKLYALQKNVDSNERQIIQLRNALKEKHSDIFQKKQTFEEAEEEVFKKQEERLKAGIKKSHIQTVSSTKTTRHSAFNPNNSTNDKSGE